MQSVLSIRSSVVLGVLVAAAASACGGATTDPAGGHPIDVVVDSGSGTMPDGSVALPDGGVSVDARVPDRIAPAVDGGTTDSPDGPSCPAAAQVAAIDYDRQCATSDDCVVVPMGSTACDPCAFACPSATISKSDEGRYGADVQRAVALIAASSAPGEGYVCAEGCTALAAAGPCCIAGLCAYGTSCQAFDAASGVAGDP